MKKLFLSTLVLAGTMTSVSMSGSYAYAGGNCKVDTCTAPDGHRYCCGFQPSLMTELARSVGAEVLENTNNTQLSCYRYPTTEGNGYPFLHLEAEKNELALVATNDSGIGSNYQPVQFQTDKNNYILTFKNSDSGKCNEFAKCYDKITLYLSKSDDDGFIKNGVYKTTEVMMIHDSTNESLQYTCRHKNLEMGFLK